METDIRQEDVFLDFLQVSIPLVFRIIPHSHLAILQGLGRITTLQFLGKFYEDFHAGLSGLDFIFCQKVFQSLDQIVAFFEPVLPAFQHFHRRQYVGVCVTGLFVGKNGLVLDLTYPVLDCLLVLSHIVCLAKG